MQLTLNKTELAGALAALGKLVCRSSPIPVYRAVQIEATDNALYFRTHSMTEEIEFRMDVETADAFKVAVDFDFFRSLVKNSRNKNLAFDFKDGKLHLDDVPIAPIEAEWPITEPSQCDNVATTPLPENFVEVLNMAAPQASADNSRPMLKGINLSRDGITSTNGKELFNFPHRFDLDELTIAFPLALMATKASGEGGITVWNDDRQVIITVRIGKWSWTARAISGAYPNWKRVMPDSDALKHFVSFTLERADRLKFFLKSVIDTMPSNASGPPAASDLSPHIKLNITPSAARRCRGQTIERKTTMLKLNASYSKKVPADTEYSSQSYHASVEVELPDGLTPEQLNARIHETFALVRDSVEAELHGNTVQQPSAATQTLPLQSQPDHYETPAQNAAKSPYGKKPTTDAAASPKQIKFLLDLARQNGYTVEQLKAKFNVSQLEDLSRTQCSRAIDQLNGKAA